MRRGGNGGAGTGFDMANSISRVDGAGGGGVEVTGVDIMLAMGSESTGIGGRGGMRSGCGATTGFGGSIG